MPYGNLILTNTTSSSKPSCDPAIRLVVIYNAHPNLPFSASSDESARGFRILSKHQGHMEVTFGDVEAAALVATVL